MGAFDDLLPKKGGTFDDLIPDYGRTLKENEVTAAGETALSKMISPLASVIPQGYRNLAEVGNEAYQSTFGDKRDFSLGDALERGHSTSDVLTYEPRTETGQLAAGRFDDLYEKGRELGRTNPDWMIRAVGVPDDIADVIEKKTSPVTQTLGEQTYDLTAGAAMGKLIPMPGARKASPYDGLRKSHDFLKGKTDAEIIDFLEKSRKATEATKEPVIPEPGQADFTRDQAGNPYLDQNKLRVDENGQPFNPELSKDVAIEEGRYNQPQRDMFDQGKEVIDTGLEPKREVSGEVIEPIGITDPKQVNAGFEATRLVSEDRPELRIQDPSEYTNVLPYRNTVFEYVYSRFPELTESLQKDAVVQRLMTEVDKWTDHLKSTLDMGGSEFAAGMRVKSKNMELMPGVRVEAGKELGSTTRSQAELNRLKAEYERSAQQLDVVVGQLSNRLKSRSKAIGSDIADNAKFSDWINDRLNSKGPEEGSIYTKGTYKEGSASANIERTMSLKDHAANVADALAQATGGKLNFRPGDSLHTALTGLAKALADVGHNTFLKAARQAKQILGKAWEKVKPYFQQAWKYIKEIQPGLSIKDVSRRPWEMTRGEFGKEAAYQGVNRATTKDNPSHWFTDQAPEARTFAEGGRGSVDKLVSGSTEPRIDIAYRSKLNTSWNPSERPSGSNHAYTGKERNRPIEHSIPLEAAADPHRYIVEQAIKNGELVPERVLNEYPDLRQSLGQTSFGKSQRGVIGEVKRAKDFEYTGNYEVESGGKKWLIFRDDAGGGWYLDPAETGKHYSENWLGFTKKEALERLDTKVTNGTLQKRELGQTKIGGSQRGGPKMEDPFKKFEKSLPVPYKPFAKQMWKELEAKKENPSFIENKEAIAVDKVLNKTVGGVNAYTRLVTPWGKEVKELLLSPGKDMPGSKLTRPAADLLVAGGNLRAFETRDPRVKYAVDNIRTAKKNVEIATHDKLFNEGGIIYAWERLNTKEQIALKKVIDKFKGKEDLTAERLIQEGMNEKQSAAYLASQKHFRDTWNELNAERVAHKQKALDPQPGYWPSSWSGDYFFEVRKRHSDGRLELIRLETGNWKGIAGRGGLAKVREKFMAEHGHIYEVGSIEQRGRKGSSKQTQQLFDQIVDSIGKNHPDKEALDRLFEAYNEELADTTRNFREHFKVNTGVEGYKGNRLGVPDHQSVKEMLYSAEGYFNDAHEYLETKHAARNVNGMLFDPEIRAQAPNALNYVRQYWDQARGVEPMLARVIDYLPEKMAESVGLSRYAPKTAVQELRAKMMLFFLGFNRPVFLLAQRVQSFQFSIPAISKMQADLGISFQSSVAVASTKGYFDHAMALVSPEKMSKLGKEALDYAVANRVVETSFLDGVRSASTMKAHKIAKFITGETMLRWADRSSRMDAYLQFVHLLDQGGLKGPELFKAAEDAMLRAMVDYSQHERPLIYKQFGLIGDLASPLTTFKHNYYSQLYMYGKDVLSHPTNPAYTKAMLAFLTTQYIMGGYMGLPGVQDFDWVIDTARAHGLVDPRTPNVTQALARWSSGLQDTKRNFLRYGAFAGMTDMDISPTFSAAALIPDQGLTGMFPVPMKAGEIAYNAANVAAGELGRLGGGQGSTMVDRANLLKEGTPSALKVIPEMLNQNPRTGMIPNPKEHMAGDIRRGPPSITDPNWIASALGTSTVKESEQRTAAYQSKLQEEAIKAQKQRLIAKGKDLRVSGKGYSKEAAEYVDLGGTMNEFVNALKDNDMAQNRTRLERQKGIPKTLGQAQKYKRLEEYGITK